MPVLLYGHSDEFAQWAAAHIPHVGDRGSFGPCQAIGIGSGRSLGDKLYAVVVYHDWQMNFATIQISMAAVSPRWATPGILRALLAYPFNQLGVNKIFTVTPHDNKPALKFNKGIGMKPEGTLRHQFGPNRHAVFMGMIRTEYEASRWYRPPTVRREAA